ncbi:hypothetical protein Dimus_001596, partial [Dionaea muscipula]
PETSPPRKSQRPGGRPSLEPNASAAAPKGSVCMANYPPIPLRTNLLGCSTFSDGLGCDWLL